MFRLSILVVAVSLAILCAPNAHAHGGGSYRGPSGPRRAPSIPCDCADAACTKCSNAGLASGEGLSTRRVRMEVKRRWGDLGQVQVKADFATRDKTQIWEGYVRVETAPVLAIVEARVKSGKEELVAARTPSRQARRGYLWERNRTLLDPLLVQQAAPGALDVRVFPIVKGVRSRVTLKGFALLPTKRRKGIRLYRTGDWYLIVLPLTEASSKGADYVDAQSKRAILFLHERFCQRRFPRRIERAREVPCVPALYAALSGAGDEAVNAATALVALPPGRRAPANLFVGKASDAPELMSAPPPPDRGTPADPVPPPPPLPVGILRPTKAN